ncbi:FAD/NAD(P)-binding protein [Patescibacteria group bacterium]|nr:FAD/NAD(P)-binding protein [Patescibacteria group bacterium]
MKNFYLPEAAKIIEVVREAPNVKWFKVRFVNKKIQQNFHFWHGQFAMVGLPGYDEAPFDICSNPLRSTEYIEFTIRKVGRLTSRLVQLQKGDLLWIRGPFGRGWPSLFKLPKKNLLVVGGGCGFVPLRSVIEEAAEQLSSERQLQVFYGCRNTEELLFENRYKDWQKKGVKLNVIFSEEKPRNKTVYGAPCSYGLVTKLFDEVEIIKNASAFLCGPPVMFKFVLKKLKEKKFADQDIYLSLERKMDCGIGICQHCACGEIYICKDGPVFNYAEIKNIPNIF